MIAMRYMMSSHQAITNLDDAGLKVYMYNVHHTFPGQYSNQTLIDNWKILDEGDDEDRQTTGSLMHAVKDEPKYTPSWMPPEMQEFEQAEELAHIKAHEAKAKQELAAIKPKLTKALLKHSKEFNLANDNLKQLQDLSNVITEKLPKLRLLSTAMCGDFSYETNPSPEELKREQRVKSCHKSRDQARKDESEYSRMKMKNDYDIINAKIRRRNIKYKAEQLASCMLSSESEQSCIKYDNINDGISPAVIQTDIKTRNLLRQKDQLQSEIKKLKDRLQQIQSKNIGLSDALN